MSVAFSSARPRSKGEVTQQTIQKVKKKSRCVAAIVIKYSSLDDGSVRSAASAGKVARGEYQKKWQLVL